MTPFLCLYVELEWRSFFAWVIISQSRSPYQMNGKWLCSLKGCWKYNTFTDLKFRQIISKISIFYWTVFIFPVRSPLCLPGKPPTWEHHTIHSTLEILSAGPGTRPKPRHTWWEQIWLLLVSLTKRGSQHLEWQFCGLQTLSSAHGTERQSFYPRVLFKPQMLCLRLKKVWGIFHFHQYFLIINYHNK